MKLEDLLGLNNLSELPTEDLRDLLRKVRHNRTTEETVAQRAETKSAKKAAATFIEKLSEEEKATLRAMLAKGDLK